MMMLPAADSQFLRERFSEHSVGSEAGMICITIPAYGLPSGYDRDKSDLLLRLNPGFPDVPPDMWWFAPTVRLANGTYAPATEHHEAHLGRQWQRWSRHLTNGQWRPGTDSLETFMALLRCDLEKCAMRKAA
jgi:hypothetical protein